MKEKKESRTHHHSIHREHHDPRNIKITREKRHRGGNTKSPKVKKDTEGDAFVLACSLSFCHLFTQKKTPQNYAYLA